MDLRVQLIQGYHEGHSIAALSQIRPVRIISTEHLQSASGHNDGLLTRNGLRPESAGGRNCDGIRTPPGIDVPGNSARRLEEFDWVP